MAELELIRRCQQGDLGAFELLFDQYKDDIYRFAYLVVREPGLAQDVTQEAFIKIYRSLGRFQFRSSFKSWVYRIVVNEAISLVRRYRLKEELAADPIGPRPLATDETWQPEAVAIDNELRQRVQAAIDNLDPLYRSVIILRYYHDFTEREIAEVIECPPGTVKSRLHRARELLRRGLDEAEAAPALQLLLNPSL